MNAKIKKGFGIVISLMICVLTVAALTINSSALSAVKKDVVVTALYPSGSIKSMTVTFQAGVGYAEAYGKIGIQTTETSLNYRNPYISASESGTADSWPSTVDNDEGFIAFGSGSEFLWSDSNSHTVTVEFDDGDISLSKDQDYYVYLWTRSPYYGIYPDALLRTLKVKDGKLLDENGNVIEGSEKTHTHSWSTEWTTDETYHWHECTADGCTVTSNADKNGYGSHTDALTYVEEVPATCKINGVLAHYECACGKLFKDASALNAATADDLVIETLPHTFGEWVETKPAEIGVNGSKERVCTVCGYKETADIAQYYKCSIEIIDNTQNIEYSLLTEDNTPVTDETIIKNGDKLILTVSPADGYIYADGNAPKAVYNSVELTPVIEENTYKFTAYAEENTADSKTAVFEISGIAVPESAIKLSELTEGTVIKAGDKLYNDVNASYVKLGEFLYAVDPNGELEIDSMHSGFIIKFIGSITDEETGDVSYCFALEEKEEPKPEPEEPVVDPYKDSAPVIPSYYVNGVNTIAPKKPAPSTSNGREDGWKKILKRINKTDEGKTVVVDMNGATEIPVEVIDAAVANKVNLKIKLDSEIIWTIDYNSLDSHSIDLDSEVVKVSKDNAQNITITLVNGKKVDFDGTVTIKLGVANNGKYANMCYVDENGTRIFVDSEKIVNGFTTLVVPEASEFIIVISDAPLTK